MTSTRAQLLAANEDAATYYRRTLLGPDATGPRTYLCERGFEALLDDTVWTVGYAPASWTGLHDHLGSLGYSDDTMLLAGLVSLSRRGTFIDRFRDRITFGIRAAGGNLVGFTARSGPAAPDRAPKYLNTCRTALYDKSSVLFGLGEAPSPAGDPPVAVLTEGPLDAIAIGLAAAGSTERYTPLALCGTALTRSHVKLLEAIGTNTIVVALDSDPAGTEAAKRAYLALQGTTARLRSISCGDDGDPAEVLRQHGPNAVTSTMTQRTHLADRIIADYIATWPNLENNAEARVSCLRGAMQLVSRMSEGDVSREVVHLATRLDLPHHVVTAELCEAADRYQPPRTSQLGIRLTRGGRSSSRLLSEMSPVRPGAPPRSRA